VKTLTRDDLSGMACSATFDDEEVYRYDLVWRWSDGPLLIGWLLNPSTATHEVLDPTVRGMIARARARGYAGVRILNLFGLRATDPRDMRRHADPIGPENDLVIRRALVRAADEDALIVAGWGRHGNHLGRQARALKLADAAGVKLHAFKINADGTPKHPLYVARKLLPQPWEAANGR
jgi:hypothetical protein